MRHIKNFESVNQDKPEIDDYVICNIVGGDTEIDDYINSNIGKYIEFVRDNMTFPCRIQYDEMSYELEEYAGKILNVDLDEIKYWSKNKEELEYLVASKKYNL